MGVPRWTAIACLLAVCLGMTSAQFREYPPRYGYHNLPQTKFTCEGKLPGRYYADPDTDCQMFHVCTSGSTANFKFLCPNGTVFDQEHQVCADYYQVVCHSTTNPLGHIFEIYKIGAKENTRAQEFGTAPSRDPVYLGQNSLQEEFQAEEYNNNKLASQNALRFQSGGEKPARKGSKSDIFYYASSSTTPRPTQPPRSTTTASTTTTTPRRPPTTTTAVPASFFESRVLEAKPIRPLKTQPILISSNPPQPQPRPQQPQPQEQFSRPVTTTTPKPAPVFKSTAPPTLPTKFDFTDFNSLSKFQYNFHHSLTTRRPPTPTTTDLPSTTPDKFAFAYTTTNKPFFNEDPTAEVQFIYNTDRSTQGTTYRTTNFPTTTYKSTKSMTQFSKTFAPDNFEDLDRPKSTTRKSLFGGDSNPFTDFKSLASFQHAFHHGFTTRAPTITPVKQFHTEVRPMPQEPADSFNYQTTAAPRKQVFHSTFRANDVQTTSETFQQPASRFNEEFFRKIESKYDTAAKTTEANFQDEPISSTRAEEYNEIVTSRPIRRGERRRRPQNQQQQQQLPVSNGQYKFSRRVENAKFEDRESFAVRDRPQNQRRNDEIFETDSSIFRGSPTINNFYNEERRPTQNRADPSAPVAPQEYTPALFGRRVRPHTRQRIVQTPDEPVEVQAVEEKPFRRGDRTRVVKRVRRPTTTTTTEFPDTTEPTTTTTTTTRTTTSAKTTQTPTTNRAVKKFQLRAKLSTTTRKDNDRFTTRPTTTTTEEPQLVTASDTEIARLRETKSTTPTTTKTSTSTSVTQPVATSFKVVEVKQPVITSVTSSFDNSAKNNTKIFVQTTKKTTSVAKQESFDANPTRSPDYDYTYYDSDVETDYLAGLVSKQETYGKKPSKSNLSKS